VTVTVAVPVFPSVVAEIVAVPAPTPVTSPAAETVATALFDDVQVIPNPVMALPLTSVGVAVS
jgi:hypothetical protein